MVSAKSILNRSKDLTKISTEVLQNKFVLYFVFVLAVGNLFHFVFKQDLMSVGMFIATGLLTSFFSKNMTVIMVVAIVVANIFQIGKGRDGFNTEEEEEGFEEKEDDEGFEDKEDDEGFEDKDDEEGFEDKDDEEGFEDDEKEEGFYSY